MFLLVFFFFIISDKLKTSLGPNHLFCKIRELTRFGTPIPAATKKTLLLLIFYIMILCKISFEKGDLNYVRRL